MTVNETECRNLVLECVRSLGETDGLTALLQANEKTKLFGPEGNLDSLGLVVLVVDIEQRAAERYGKNVVLADEKAMSRQTSPFRNVESLSRYLAELLMEPPSD